MEIKTVSNLKCFRRASQSLPLRPIWDTKDLSWWISPTWSQPDLSSSAILVPSPATGLPLRGKIDSIQRPYSQPELTGKQAARRSAVFSNKYGRTIKFRMENINNKSDSEDEVFFSQSTKPTTSTPLEKISYGKRKRVPAQQTGRRTRSRKEKMSVSGEENMSGSEEEAISLAAFMKKMTKDMALMNNNIASINETIRTNVAEAIAPVTARLDANCRRMDRMEISQRNEIEEIKQRLDDAFFR